MDKLTNNIVTDLILMIVCDHLGCTRKDLMKNCRKYDLKMGRYYCYYFMRQYTNLSLERIGMYFHRDHATVVNGLGKINDWKRYADVRYNIDSIDEKVSSMLVSMGLLIIPETVEA